MSNPEGPEHMIEELNKISETLDLLTHTMPSNNCIPDKSAHETFPDPRMIYSEPWHPPYRICNMWEKTPHTYAMTSNDIAKTSPRNLPWICQNCNDCICPQWKFINVVLFICFCAYDRSLRSLWTITAWDMKIYVSQIFWGERETTHTGTDILHRVLNSLT